MPVILPPTRQGIAMIAYFDASDGNPKVVLKIRSGRKEKEIEAGMIENPRSREAIAGLELFSPYIAIIDFKNKKINFYTESQLKKAKF